MSMKDVTVIGGGVIGCAIARELTRYRIDVVLAEREVEVGFGTAKSNSGIILGGHHSKPGTLKGELAWAGNQRWVELSEELGFGFRELAEPVAQAQANASACIPKRRTSPKCFRPRFPRSSDRTWRIRS